MATYRTIRSQTTSTYQDRGSKFIAYSIPAATIEDCHIHIDRIKGEHPKARHWCYAYRIGATGEHHRLFDDGEPSGTAGRPIAQQIESFDLTNILVIVVRYFGGKLLGTSGLINAYKSSARDALAKAEVVEKEEAILCKFRFRYAIMGRLLSVLKNSDEVEVFSKELGTTPSVTVSIPSASFEKRLTSVLSEILGVHEIELNTPLIFPDLEIEIIED